MAKRLHSEQLDHESDVQLVETMPRGFLTVSDDTPLEQWPTSLPVGTPLWKAYLVNAATTPDLTLQTGEEIRFTAVHWLVCRCERDDPKGGAPHRFTALILFDAHGDTLLSSSEYARHDLARILRAYSPEEWAQGITFRLKSRPNKAGDRSYHQLRVVPREG